MAAIEKMAEALWIANNAIYFDDSSDYRTALYQVCSALGMAKDDIGAEYIEESALAEKDERVWVRMGKIELMVRGGFCPHANAINAGECPYDHAPGFDECIDCVKAYLTESGE